jgi:hypothetical protein
MVFRWQRLEWVPCTWQHIVDNRPESYHNKNPSTRHAKITNITGGNCTQSFVNFQRKMKGRKKELKREEMLLVSFYVVIKLAFIFCCYGPWCVQCHFVAAGLWRITDSEFHIVFSTKSTTICEHFNAENTTVGDPSRWPRGTLYPQKLVLASPTSGGRSVGIVRTWTQATEFFLILSITKAEMIKTA